MKDKVERAITRGDTSIRTAIKQLNESGLQIILVVDQEGRLIGTVTDGDIRRAILNNLSLDEPVSRIMNASPKFVFRGEEEKADDLMVAYSIKTVPVVDWQRRVVDLITINDCLVAKAKMEKYPPKTNQVVIMAGGKGTRLDPFTKILPKPLIPIGERPIIEIIMDNFKRHGFNRFILSLNYKAEMLRLYFLENPNGYEISYVQEEDYLGTAGSLRLARDSLKETFIVSNCDVIIEMNFDELLNHHRSCGNHATIVGVVKNLQIPYGVIETKDGNLMRMVEKPEYDLVINAGIYALEPELIELIPERQPIDMPDLLLKAKGHGYKVGVYPVSSKWFDVGQWEEYRNTLEYFKAIERA